MVEIASAELHYPAKILLFNIFKPLKMKIYLNFVLIMCMYYKDPFEFVSRNELCVSAIEANQ